MIVKKKISEEQLVLILIVFVSLVRLLKIPQYMSRIFSLFVVTLMSLQAIAQQTITAATIKSTSLNTATIAPALADDALLIKETDFDFGKIPQGKPVTHIFEIVNNGKDSLRIVNVQASCGCTTPEWERDKAIGPGAKTAITVGYNAASEGPFSKPVTITYNGTQIKQINIRGEVWKTPVTSAPEKKSFENL